MPQAAPPSNAPRARSQQRPKRSLSHLSADPLAHMAHQLADGQLGDIPLHISQAGQLSGIFRHEIIEGTPHLCRTWRDPSPVTMKPVPDVSNEIFWHVPMNSDVRPRDIGERGLVSIPLRLRYQTLPGAASANPEQGIPHRCQARTACSAGSIRQPMSPGSWRCRGSHTSRP